MARSSYYYEPAPESEENLQLMRLLDEQYTRIPFYGTRKMTAWLQTQGYEVNRKRVRRLLRQMGLEADRKSTRLNSSHLVISDAVFCLKTNATPPMPSPSLLCKRPAWYTRGAATTAGPSRRPATSRRPLEEEPTRLSPACDPSYCLPRR